MKFFLLPYSNGATKEAEVFLCLPLPQMEWIKAKFHNKYCKHQLVIKLINTIKTNSTLMYSAVSRYSESISLWMFRKKKQTFLLMKDIGVHLPGASIQKNSKDQGDGKKIRRKW